MKRHEATIGLHSQNVMGFAKAEDNLQRWFSHFRQKDALGCLDLVLLQETHVEPHEIPGMTAKHSRNWGFDLLHQDRTFSYWSAASERKGGVAILCSPYSQVQQMRPYLQAHWNSHWMAVTAEMYGETVLIVNIYAPHERPLREQFFNYLLSLQIRHPGPILCGGDFNCTLNAEADRSLQRTAAYHDSPGLRRLLQEWSAGDVLQREADEALDSRDRSSFYQSYHTYHYSLASGETGSSRLDRWYVSAEHDRWVRCVSQAVPGPYSDHDGVSLRVAAPHCVVRVKKQRRVYPVPAHVRNLADGYTSSLFTSLRTELDGILALPETEKEKAVRAAQWWDQTKHRFLMVYVSAKKECDIKLRNSYKQRLRRLNAAMRKAASATKDQRGVRHDETIPAQEMAEESLHVIRRRIAECRQSWAETKAQRLRRAHTFHPLRSSRDFFRRIATKFGDNTVYSLGPTPAGSPRVLANQMADGWMGLMRQPSESLENIKSYLDTVVPPASATNLAPLDTRITTTEITEAIKRCKRGKTQDPDELKNDWYRDHLDQLVPLFDKLFNLWFEQGVTSLSFHEANVQCLKKTRTASRPLEHRPIALLNSDYKVYTKIFSSRLRSFLPDLIHPLQAGFVPGRSIHTPIDTFLAIRKLAGKETKLAKAIGLLLDFAKPYDSLSRPFLLCALRLYGFSQQFVDMVAALHDETSVRFLVNGYLSKSVNVTCGIRQGCPLAPLLFIITIDVLYRVVEASPELEGVRLIGAELDTTVKISGYADDTALYVTDDSKIPQVISLLNQFGHYSGLRVNLKKSVGALMSENGATEEVRGCGISILPADDTCRYLGIQVGTRDAREANWIGCVDALRVRLALAFAKTHSVIQRAEIARAVIVPKLLYLARHVWPTESTVTELHKFIKSFVWGKTNGRTRRAWVSEEQAELPLQAGGISMPNVRTELLTLSAYTVGKWADNSTTFERLIGDILLDSEQIQAQYITPRFDAKLPPQTMGTSLWATGTSIIRHAYARTHTDEDIRGIRACAETIMRSYNAAVWHCGQLVVDVGELISPAVTARIAHAKKCYGTFCEEWLQMCSTSEDGWLLDRKGTVYDLSKARISNGCVSLRDLVRWTWVRRGCVLFEYVPGHEFTTAPSIRPFQRLCFALLYNFPQLLFRPTRFLQLKPYDARIQQHHE